MSRREEIQRRKVAKILQEQISKTTDPAMIHKLTTQYNKLMKLNTPNPKVSTSATGKRPRPKTGSALDDLSDEDYLIHMIVLRAETIKKTSRELSTPAAIQQAVSELQAEGTITAE